MQAVQPPVGDFATAFPLLVVRIADHAMATIPGEATATAGKQMRHAVETALPASTGVKGVALVGYANEYLHYFTTPEEYEMQHYEGGSTVYGKYSSNLIRDDLATLAGDIAQGSAPPAPVSFDPRHGLVPNFTPYPSGATSGKVAAQPTGAHRLRRATFAWQGGERGFDRPFDRAFVAVQRLRGKRWQTVTDDLGLEILWRVDDNGRYSAEWQVPLSAPTGRYRFSVTARQYRLTSKPFGVYRSHALMVHSLGGGKVTLDYPQVDAMKDLTARPAHANGGKVRAVQRRRGTVFTLSPGARIPAGAAQDRFGNTNGKSATVK
ncbi:MAG: neutral/alkaline non-lysosomal ceramidase N-terminal domain-containing protein [Anaeromyxobacteraceae bacterium]